MHFPSKAQQGFTLIEMMVVITLTVMLMLTATSVFMSGLIGNTKTDSTLLIKEEGDYAMSQIEFLLRNAVALKPNSVGQTCTTGMTEMAIQSTDNGITTLSKVADSSDGKQKIASNSGVYLTSGRVELTAGPVFDCSRTSDKGVTFVTVSFTLRKGTPGVDQERDIVEETFNTGITLRSL